MVKYQIPVRILLIISLSCMLGVSGCRRKPVMFHFPLAKCPTNLSIPDKIVLEGWLLQAHRDRDRECRSFRNFSMRRANREEMGGSSDNLIRLVQSETCQLDVIMQYDLNRDPDREAARKNAVIVADLVADHLGTKASTDSPKQRLLQQSDEEALCSHH